MRPGTASTYSTYERIVRAARQLFGELGYEATTFRAIADRAAVTRPLVNYHFASKPALYNAGAVQTNAAIVSVAMKRACREKTLVQTLSTFVAAALEAGARDPAAAAFVTTSLMVSQRYPHLGGVSATC